LLLWPSFSLLPSVYWEVQCQVPADSFWVAVAPVTVTLTSALPDLVNLKYQGDSWVVTVIRTFSQPSVLTEPVQAG
jgi:hypothetical protein